MKDFLLWMDANGYGWLIGVTIYLVSGLVLSAIYLGIKTLFIRAMEYFGWDVEDTYDKFYDQFNDVG